MRALQQMKNEPRHSYHLPRYCGEREKGLFPFKGKGGLLKYLDQIEGYAAELEQAEHDLAQRYNPILKHYDLALAVQNEQKRGYLVPMVRWRGITNRTMGMARFDRVFRLVQSEGERRKLHEIEVERCLLNHQAGVVNATTRRLRTTLESLEHADELLKAEPIIGVVRD